MPAWFGSLRIRLLGGMEMRNSSILIVGLVAALGQTAAAQDQTETLLQRAATGPTSKDDANAAFGYLQRVLSGAQYK